MKLLLSLLLFLFLLCACEKAVPAGRIRVKNDIQDRSYNTITVSAGGQTTTLQPGESTLLVSAVTQITLSRRYKDSTRMYRIQCPRSIGSGITIKMIDAHLNRIAGGCETVFASHN